MTLIPSVSFFNPHIKENKQIIEGAATGITDFGLSQVFIMKKNQIQAGATVVKKVNENSLQAFLFQPYLGNY